MDGHCTGRAINHVCYAWSDGAYVPRAQSGACEWGALHPNTHVIDATATWHQSTDNAQLTPPPSILTFSEVRGRGLAAAAAPGFALRAKPTLAKPSSTCAVCLCVFVLCVCVCLCVFVSVCVCLCCVVWVLVSRFWFGHVECPQDRPSREPPFPGPPFPGPPSPWTAQNFALFSPLPPQNSF